MLPDSRVDKGWVSVPLMGLLPFCLGGWWAGAIVGGRAPGPNPFGSTNWVCDLGQVTHLSGVRAREQGFLETPFNF